MSERNHHPKNKRAITRNNNTNLPQSALLAVDSSIRSSPFNVVAVAVDGLDDVDDFESTESSIQQQQQQQHLIAIPIGSGSDTSSDSDTVSGPRIVKKKKAKVSTGSNLIMTQVRQRRNYLMNTLSRWDSSSKKSSSENKKSKNNQYNNAQVAPQQQQSVNNTGTASTPQTFSQTLIISIASMCLVSLCTTMVWMFQVPHFSNNQGSHHSVHQWMPSYDTSRSTSTSRSSTSTTFRPPPLLSVGGGAKFYIDPDASSRRLEKIVNDHQEYDEEDEVEVYDIESRRYNAHPKNVISFRNIAQRGSTDRRIHANRNPNIADLTTFGEVDTITRMNIDDRIAVKATTAISKNTVSVPSSSDVDLNLETGRSTRFPSVDERVRVYMSNWYLPPCPSTKDSSNDEAFVEYNFQINDHDGIEYMMFREVRTLREKKHGLLRTFIIDDTTNFDVLRHLNRNNMESCAKKSSYCKDFVKYLYPAMERAANNTSSTVKTDGIDVSHIDNNVLMYQFSDAEKTRAYNMGTGKITGYPNVPNLKKFRYALSKEERERILSSNSNDNNNCMVSPRPIPITILQQQMMDEGETKIIPTSQPIIMKLKIQRHYGYVEKIPSLDVDWTKKKNQAIFRGQFTGRFPVGMDTDIIKGLPAIEQCNLLHRCRLVYNAALNMKLIDAKLALPVLDVRKDFPQVINDVALYGDRVSIEDMLKYKAIIMLEGNDVSSGLKWALYSNSVVMTQTPTKTSWAMEELLEPWVHYVPLNDDLSDVEEKMQWIIDHDEEAQQIAYRGKLWIHDLVFHPDAATDEASIFDEILQRTKAHYMRNLNLEVPMVDINVEK